MNVLQKSIGCLLLAGAALGLAGCNSSGMSSRETEGNNFNAYSQALYEAPMHDTRARPANSQAADGSQEKTMTEEVPPAKPLEFPIRLGVAQIGEVAVADTLLSPLREHGELYTQVQSISGYGDPNELPGYDQGNTRFRQQNAVREHLRRIRAIAGDMGLTHVLLIGGTIDQSSSGTGLKVLDLTIIGAFIVPSEKIVADAKGGAYLLDVPTGRVMLSASAAKRTSKLAPSFGAESAATDQLLDVRDDVMADLLSNFVDQCGHRKQSLATAQPAKAADPAH